WQPSSFGQVSVKFRLSDKGADAGAARPGLLERRSALYAWASSLPPMPCGQDAYGQRWQTENNSATGGPYKGLTREGKSARCSIADSTALSRPACAARVLSVSPQSWTSVWWSCWRCPPPRARLPYLFRAMPYGERTRRGRCAGAQSCALLRHAGRNGRGATPP